jgi:hypothetical protein
MTKQSKTEIVLEALLAEVESVSTCADGTKWGQVYLDNARPEGISVRSFRSCLAALSAKGLYQSQGDDCFGDVRLA